MRLTPRVAGFRSEYPAGFKLECMAGFVGTRTWEGGNACTCGGAGMPCPRCNATLENETPRLPAGFKTEFDKKGWRH